MAVHLLDYGAGNVRSIRNAIVAAGFAVVDIVDPHQFSEARVVVFPGVGAFGAAMSFLEARGFKAPLEEYLRAGRPYMGICIGLQALFEGSDESPGAVGLGIIPGRISRFPSSEDYSVPHIGWNGVTIRKPSPGMASISPEDRLYYVHSFRAVATPANAEWVCATTDYGGGEFIGALSRGNIFATQFHPEKSSEMGLEIFRSFLAAALRLPAAAGTAAAAGTTVEQVFLAGAASMRSPVYPLAAGAERAHPQTLLAKRIVACLDVRTNDEGDLVVTKGDQYDVREKPDASGTTAAGGGRPVRNLGKPVDLCARYYAEGADEVALLNITAYRGEPLEDAPLLAVLEAASLRVFVPLTIGGGIRAYADAAGRAYSALDVAARYFRAGADKVSIGSDAVAAAEAYYAAGARAAGDSAIEAIARVYGSQAVVVSIDPRRVYEAGADAAAAAAAAAAAGRTEPGGHPHTLVRAPSPGPRGEVWCWYQATVRGGREGRPLCAHRLAQAAAALGAGELLVNSVDADGQRAGFDAALLGSLREAVRVPVIASSGAGTPEHFSAVFARTRCEAALAAGIFHRREVAIADVKAELSARGMPIVAMRAAAAAPAAAVDVVSE